MPKATTASATQRARVWWALLTEPGDRVVGALIDEIGPRRAARAINDTSDPRRAVSRQGIRDVTAAELAALRHRYPRRPGREQVDAVYRYLDHTDTHLLEPGHAVWPGALDDLGPHRPLLLFARGNLGLLAEQQRSVAVVGTRKPSIEGARAARIIGDALSDGDQITVSGGALGIDAIVHRSSLQNNRPTILVTATSLDRVYPREHRGLFDTVATRGLLVSETPPTAAISPKSFLARNRIIAALSRETIVVECPIRSGALNTASHTASLGRDLWAVSYPVRTDTNEGWRRLIDEWGARELSAEDLLDDADVRVRNHAFLKDAV